MVTSFLENCVIAIKPQVENPAYASRALHLSFWAEVGWWNRAMRAMQATQVMTPPLR